jgi:beta-fructofuranosidase
VWDDDVLHYAGYAVGSYADGSFTATSWGRLTYGPSYYAPSFFRDADGRPCLLFWMRGVQDAATGWASAHSVPHVLTLDGDTLVATPHPDLARYRGTRIEGGRLDGLAGDLAWYPAADDELRISSGSRPVATLRTRADALDVHVGEESWSVPGVEPRRSGIRIILDGPVLEVSTSAGIFGVAITPAGDRFVVESAEGRVEGHDLVR